MRFLGDVRFALRILARNPSYAAAAVTVLALGIGAVTAMFTVVRVSASSRCRTATPTAS